MSENATTTPDQEHLLTAVALVEASLEEKHDDLERMLGWFDDPDARAVISALTDMSMAEIRDHHPTSALPMMRSWREHILDHHG